MCDYSLEHYDTRKAAKGDNLVIQKFPSGSSGFVAAGDSSNTAVCLMPGAKLMIEKPGEAPREAIFVQRKKQQMTYRDAIKYAGETDSVLLTQLPPGTKAHVVALSSFSEKEDLEPTPTVRVLETAA